MERRFIFVITYLAIGSCGKSSLCALGTPPLPPSEGIGGGPKERGSLAFSHRATPSASQLELAEGVEFLEKYAHLDHLESPFGGRGSSAALGRSGGPWAARHPARQSEGPLGHLATPARSREG